MGPDEYDRACRDDTNRLALLRDAPRFCAEADDGHNEGRVRMQNHTGTRHPTRRATSVDVARRAGVNQSTVSRAFSGSTTIAEATRARVFAAAQELGYTPNALARGLITKQTGMVGIVVAGITSPFQPYVLERFIRDLGATGRQALVFAAAPGQEVDDMLPLARQYQVDALIVTSATLSSAHLAASAREGTPILLFNRTVPDTDVDSICCDNAAGGQAAADRLLAAGHRRFAYIAGNTDSSTNRDRERGYTERLHACGVADICSAQAAYTYESGVIAARELLARADPPDALFCASDIIALGALDAIRRAGIRVPDDLSIIGFDDIPMAHWGAYDLTTIRQPVDAMIAATLALLDERLAAPNAPRAVRLFPGALVERASVRPSLTEIAR